MNDKTIAAMQLALETLEDWGSPLALPAIVALQEALAQQCGAKSIVWNVLWSGDCVLGHCNSPAGCENSEACRAGEYDHGIKEPAHA